MREETGSNILSCANYVKNKLPWELLYGFKQLGQIFKGSFDDIKLTEM